MASDFESPSGSGDELKSIFGLLEKNFPESAGNASVPEELLQRMEDFSKGRIPAGEIEPICAQILESPEAMRAFAQILAAD